MVHGIGVCCPLVASLKARVLWVDDVGANDSVPTGSLIAGIGAGIGIYSVTVVTSLVSFLYIVPAPGDFTIVGAVVVVVVIAVVAFFITFDDLVTA